VRRVAAVALLALAAIAARISEFGFTPNRVAALGENLILLVNLAGSAWLYARFLRQQNPFGALERWQVLYLPVYSLWAALVVIVFPLVFREKSMSRHWFWPRVAAFSECYHRSKASNSVVP